MKLLAEHLDDPELRDLYRGLLASEARHHRSYVTLAQEIAGDRDVSERLRTLAEHEAEVLSRMPKHLPRMHT
jgi:tRNA-(ms[2]io[6]A)-hydroxylase